MLLTTYKFAAFFFIIVVAYFVTPPRFRWIVLLAGSYYFFAVGGKPQYIPLILLSTAVTYYCGLRMGAKERRSGRGPLLALSILVNLGLLFFFKYLTIFGVNMDSLLSHMKIFGAAGEAGFLIPLGISFYTLQTLSYLIDVYRGDIEPERHFGYLALYVCFFPTLLAGPIERGSHLLPQLHGHYRFEYDRVTYAIKLFAWGLFLKIVVADRLAIFVNQVYGDVRKFRGLPLLLATIFFAVQLYSDFAGYTNMTRGCAMILGYDLLENFDKPYFSKNVREFWRRWHISLTSWLRDYLYIPLGGNQVSRWRVYVNVFIVFVLSGLWHGASWTFVLWGALHGLYYLVYMAVTQITASRRSEEAERREGRILTACKIVFTFILVDLAWVFFRANSVSDALYVFRNMFAFGWSDLSHFFTSYFQGYGTYLLVILFLFVVGLIGLRGSIIKRIGTLPIYVRWAIYYAFLFTMLIFAVTTTNQFIYAQF